MFFDRHFDTDYDMEGPRAALARAGAELDRPDPDLNLIRELLLAPGVEFNRRFMVAMVIQRFQQAEAGKPGAEDARILREMLEGLRNPTSSSIARLRELARALPAERLASGDPAERAAGERLREKLENL
jgi:hypothetical protein